MCGVGGKCANAGMGEMLRDEEQQSQTPSLQMARDLYPSGEAANAASLDSASLAAQKRSNREAALVEHL